MYVQAVMMPFSLVKQLKIDINCFTTRYNAINRFTATVPCRSETIGMDEIGIFGWQVSLRCNLRYRLLMHGENVDRGWWKKRKVVFASRLE